MSITPIAHHAITVVILIVFIVRGRVIAITIRGITALISHHMGIMIPITGIRGIHGMGMATIRLITITMGMGMAIQDMVYT